MSESVAKTMLIVKSDQNGLKGVEQFLKNRDWKIVSTHEMKSAIMHLMQMKPAFVLITVDHPNKKMLKFPKMILAAFPTCVMTFAEKSTTTSFKALMDSGVEYKINPPLTGPAIERAVNKFLRDLENAGKQKNNPTQAQKDNHSFKVEIKNGSGKSGAGFVNVKAQSGESPQQEPHSDLAEKLLAQLNDDDSESDEGALNHLNSSNSNNPGSQQGPAYRGSAFNSKSDPGAMKSSGIAHAGSMNQRPAKAADGKDLQQPGPSTDAEGDLWVPVSKKAEGSLALNPGEKNKNDIMIGRAKGRKDGSYNPDQQDSNDPSSPHFDPSKSSDAQTLNSQNLKKQKYQSRIPTGVTKIKSDSIFNQDSIFVKGVNKTIEETTIVGEGHIESHLEDNTHLACIIVESPKFSGYLVAALGKDKKIDDEFVDLIRVRLMKFLAEAGELVQNDGNMQVKVKRVDFEGWALEYAQFLRKSVHKGDEVAMAFFPFADAQVKVGVSSEASMASVKTSEIEPGKPLEFNLFIYLPTNKKYILYTPKGSVFQENQKDRLIRQGVGEVHIRKDEVEGLSRYKAQNHLNSLIDQYDQSSAAPKDDQSSAAPKDDQSSAAPKVAKKQAS
jgi:hypothetical protein